MPLRCIAVAMQLISDAVAMPLARPRQRQRHLSMAHCACRAARTALPLSGCARSLSALRVCVSPLK